MKCGFQESLELARCWSQSKSALLGMSLTLRGALIVCGSSQRCVSIRPSATVSLKLFSWVTGGLSPSSHVLGIFSAKGHCMAKEPSLIVSTHSSKKLRALAGEGPEISENRWYVLAARVFSDDLIKQFGDSVRTRGWVNAPAVRDWLSDLSRFWSRPSGNTRAGSGEPIPPGVWSVRTGLGTVNSRHSPPNKPSPQPQSALIFLYIPHNAPFPSALLVPQAPEITVRQESGSH